jgi:hypothetical protein
MEIELGLKSRGNKEELGQAQRKCSEEEVTNEEKAAAT